MRSPVAVVVVVVVHGGAVDVPLAHADDEDLDPARVAERYAAELPPEPALRLDPMLRPNTESLGTIEIHHTKTLHLGGTALVLDGSERLTQLDVESRGWRTEAQLRRNLGFAWLTAGVAAGGVQSRYATGTYVEQGVALTKTFKLSRWNTAWISLSVGRRRWNGVEPPPGEINSTQVTLSIGTTFK